MAAAGVPVVPGGELGEDDDVSGRRRSTVGYPLLVKASAGGGGKGMRPVAGADELEAAVAGARREAAAAFGDRRSSSSAGCRGRATSRSRCSPTPATIVSLGERECSVQRRHQKVLEEAPSVAVDEPLRAALGAAAVARRDGGRLRRRRDRRVPARRGRRVLLPRDEHAAAGRAPGHRDGARHRPRRRAAADRRRRGDVGPGAGRAGSAATRSRSASTPRTPRRAFCRRPAPSSGSRSPAPSRSRSRARRRPRRCASTPASRTARRSGPTTTRCSPS